MKAPPPPKSPETDEQKLDSPLSRIMNIVTPPPTQPQNPWSIEQQTQRDIQIVSMILRRYCSHRDKLELRGGRTIGIGELCDAMIDRADLCCLFNGEPRRRDCDCGCGDVACERDRANVVEEFNKALK
jgi:hypothetical protein